MTPIDPAARAAALLGSSAKNAELYSEAQENSVRDALTGCFNRRQALHVLDSELRRAHRPHGAFSLVMLDLDHFKTINDRFGHLCGDAVLAHVGQRMKAVLRGSDTKCRYGGEEFLVLLPERRWQALVGSPRCCGRISSSARSAGTIRCWSLRRALASRPRSSIA